MNRSDSPGILGRGAPAQPDWRILLLLSLAVLAVYSQVLEFSFVSFDDGIYVTRNAQVQSGLSWETVRWAFSTRFGGNWHPMTWLSHAADVSLFGMRPGMHHATSVVIHLANTILLYVLLFRMTRQPWPCAAVAFLFALHPLHVESVAWVSERKDVLSTFFGFGSMLAWLRYLERRTLLRYLGVLALFALSLLAKSMWVTLPVLLLLLDHWPLGRAQGLAVPVWRTYARLALEKLPLFLLALLFGLIALFTQGSTGTLATLGELTFPIRACNTAIALCDYLSSMVFPFGLAAFYPHPGYGFSLVYAIASMLFLAGMTWASIATRIRFPFLFTGWGWYLVSVAPVSGLIQVGSQARADRYTYLPLVGIFIGLAWAGDQLVQHRQFPAKPLALGGGIVAAGLMVLTFLQIGHWRNSKALWSRALQATTPRNWLAHQGLAEDLLTEGRYREAADAFTRAIEILPDDAGGRFVNHLKLGDCWLGLGDRKAALKEYRQALLLEPEYTFTCFKIGLLLVDLGRGEDAIPYLERVLRAKPGELGIDSAFAGKVTATAKRRLLAIKAAPINQRPLR